MVNTGVNSLVSTGLQLYACQPDTQSTSFDGSRQEVRQSRRAERAHWMDPTHANARTPPAAIAIRSSECVEAAQTGHAGAYNDSMASSPRRLAVLLGLIVCALWTVDLTAQAPRFRVTLLGTGSPPPRMDRFGPATLVEAGTDIFLFDAGRGVLQRLAQTGTEYRNLRALFLTHLHSDHIVGLPDLWLTGWLVSHRDHPLQVFGPKGTSDFAIHLARAFAYDLGIRADDDGGNPAGSRLEVTEIEEGVLYRQDGVTITAFNVDHRPVAPAFGYRVDYGGHSAVISGDTRMSENLVKWAKGADLLIHEVAYRTGETQATSRILAHHTLPAQAGDVFSRVAPRLAVYSHVGVSQDVSDARLIEMTRATYKGPLVVGADLMSFDIGETVRVNPPPVR